MRRNDNVIFTRGIKYYLHLVTILQYRSRAPILYTYLPIYTYAVCAVNDLLLLLLYSRSVGQSCAYILYYKIAKAHTLDSCPTRELVSRWRRRSAARVRVKDRYIHTHTNKYKYVTLYTACVYTAR